jgi:hypothetical protein
MESMFSALLDPLGVYSFPLRILRQYWGDRNVARGHIRMTTSFQGGPAILVKGSLQEAKRRLDMLIGFPTPEITD